MESVQLKWQEEKFQQVYARFRGVFTPAYLLLRIQLRGFATNIARASALAGSSFLSRFSRVLLRFHEGVHAPPVSHEQRATP